MSCVFLHCFLQGSAFAARRIDPLDDPARAGCAGFVKLARKIRLSSKIQQKVFTGTGKRGRLFLDLLGRKFEADP
jgi:hypothetical protein